MLGDGKVYKNNVDTLPFRDMRPYNIQTMRRIVEDGLRFDAEISPKLYGYYAWYFSDSVRGSKGVEELYKKYMSLLPQLYPDWEHYNDKEDVEENKAKTKEQKILVRTKTGEKLVFDDLRSAADFLNVDRVDLWLALNSFQHYIGTSRVKYLKEK